MLQQQAKYAEAAALYERAARLLSAAGDKEGLLPVLLAFGVLSLQPGAVGREPGRHEALPLACRIAEEKVEVLVAEGNVLVSLCRWDEAVENWERALALAPPEGCGLR